jgi:hypothetical protein
MEESWMEEMEEIFEGEGKKGYVDVVVDVVEEYFEVALE